MALAAGASGARAQDRIYISQFSPQTRLHGLRFTGSAFETEDLNPNSPLTYLRTGQEIMGLSATGRFLFGSTFSSTIGMATFDTLNGVELPRTGTTITFGTPPLVGSDQQFAYMAGVNSAGVALLSTVDLRPSSPTFLKEVATLNLGVSGAAGAAALHPAGGKIYVSVTTVSPSIDGAMQIKVIDVSTPGSPVLQSSVSVPQPSGGSWPSPGPGPNTSVSNLRVFRR